VPSIETTLLEQWYPARLEHLAIAKVSRVRYSTAMFAEHFEILGQWLVIWAKKASTWRAELAPPSPLYAYAVRHIQFALRRRFRNYFIGWLQSYKNCDRF
jgi:hypothetical protein